MNTTDTLVEKAVAIYVNLRAGYGYSEADIAEFIEALAAWEAEWRGRELIPRRVAEALCSLPTAMYNCAFAYSDEQKNPIMDVADSLAIRIETSLATEA
jgi:hypothetical protein